MITPTEAESRLVVVMGVSGSGKSTVGVLLAERTGVPYAEGDEFHPQANIEKMSAGTPLTDEDRWPWLESVGRWLAQHVQTGGVATCSALKRTYRDTLRQHAPSVWFLHLQGDSAVIEERLSQRADRFMPAVLFGSQLEALEPPGDDERAVVLDTSDAPGKIVEAFLAAATARHRGQ